MDEGRVFGGHNVRAPRRELLSRKGADRPCRRRPPGQLLHHFVVLSEATADGARSECDLTKRTTDLDRLAAAPSPPSESLVSLCQLLFEMTMRNSVGPSVGRSPNEIVCGLPRVSETGSRPIQRAEATGDGRCHFDFPYRARRSRAGAWAASGAVLVIPCVIVGRCRKGGRGRRKALEGEGQVAFLKFRITSDVSIIPHLFVTQLGRWAGRRRRRRPVVISLSRS